MSQKIVITKAGFNALTETDPDNLIFSSDYATLKYYSSGTLSLSISSGDNEDETSVAHNLGYKPFFVVFLELDFSLGAGDWACVPFNLDDTFVRSTVTASVDNTNLYVTAKTTDTFSDIDLNFRYKIFRNSTGL